ncbi:MAG: NADase-type glycan-binding domain-containing protein, partial [Myxococcota bacterium]
MSTLLLAALLAAPGAYAKATASSVVEDDQGKHAADLALDGLLSTGWAEGGVGHGEGAWWEFDLGSATKLETISFWGGNLADGRKSFREYARPKLVRVYVDGVQQGEKDQEGNFKGFRLQDEMKRIDIPVDVTGKKVRLEIVETFEGFVFADCYISEVAINFTEGERARAVEKVEAWRTSKEGLKLHEKHEEQVLEAWKKHKDDEDENEGLDFLMAAAADGAPYLRKKVTSLVPEGYRAAAIVPDPKSMEAILKLKDPNGIPGLEMAALRSIGKQQKEIRETIEIFYAYQELRSGGRRNIKAWGEEGWEVGALRSFGEPLALEIDRFGQVYVADTGNNRVQLFNQDGLSEKQWGPKPDVSNFWFSKTRTWYASGSASTDERGGFQNVVDVELIPGKEADRFATLDATGRVQIFDENGQPLIGWTARVEHFGDSTDMCSLVNAKSGGC